MMLVIGLTGSIGMGKTTAAQRFAANSIPVFDADAEVHRLYEGSAAPLIEQAFPGTTRSGKVDRAALAKVLMADKKAIPRLESIVHPLVRVARQEFLDAVEVESKDRFAHAFPPAASGASARAASVKARTPSTGVSGRQPCPRFRMWPRAGLAASAISRTFSKITSRGA